MVALIRSNVQAILEETVKKFFYNIGYFIGLHPYKILLISALLFTACSAGFLKFEEQNSIRNDYTASDSPSIHEYSVVQQFFKEKGTPFYLYVSIRARDGSDLLTRENINTILRLENYLQNNLTVTWQGERVNYKQLCGAHCESNIPLRLFLVAWRSGRRSRQFILEHPNSEILGETLYLGNHLYLLEKDGPKIQSVRMVLLHFQATYSDQRSEELLKLFENKVYDQIYAQNREPTLDIAMISEGLISVEVRRAGMAGFPFLSLTLAAIVAFTVVTSLKLDPVKSKPWEAVAGVACPMIALSTAFGFLLWIGYTYHPMVTVAPFLILAVGVDDAFLTLHAWHRTDRKLLVQQRMALTLADTGPSITITSLTNALSFGIGAFSPTPAIRYFCTYTCVAIVIEYLFQIFFFSAVMVLGGRREAAKQNAYCSLCIGVTDEKKSHKLELYENIDVMAGKFLDKWTTLAISWPARGVVVVVMLIYWSIAIYGIVQMKVELSVNKLFLHDSPLQKWIEVQNAALFKEGNKLYVFVNNPGNLSDPDRLRQINKLVHSFEDVPVSLGQESTTFWLRDFRGFQSFMSNSNAIQYNMIPNFLHSSSYSRWSNYLSVNETECAINSHRCLDSFLFTTGFGNATQWVDRLALLQNYRQLASNFSQLNVTIYEEYAMFADQIFSITHATKINLCIAICCMTIVCAIFIPNILSIISASLSVLSINLGVFGFLMLWSVDLDPISMATILMSVGFSVDFTAHVSYHYFRGTHTTVHSRLRHALACVAWPTLQAGLSTFLAVIVLSIVDAYMTIVFVKTVLLVIVFGFIHGLCILPVLLTAIPFQKINILESETSSGTT